MSHIEEFIYEAEKHRLTEEDLRGETKMVYLKENEEDKSDEGKIRVMRGYVYNISVFHYFSISFYQ